MGGFINGIKYDAVFGKNISLTTSDLKLRGNLNPTPGVLPAGPAHGDWYLITDASGVLPAPVGVVHPGDAVFYCDDAGWFKGKANSVGVFTINGQDGAVTLTTDDISDAADLKKFISQAEKIKLSTIQDGAQVNDTASVIKTKYESNLNTNNFSDAYRSKLDLIEDEAQVNVIESIKFNGVVLTPDGNKLVEFNTGAVFRIRGSVANYSELTFVPYKEDGDTYQTLDTGVSYYFLNGAIESMGASIDLSSYYTKSEVLSKGEVTALLANKVDASVGLGLSEESYTTVEKTKLSGIEEGAEKNTGTVLVSLTDLVAGELQTKIVPGDNITIDVVDAGGDEKLKISSTGGSGGGVGSVNGVLPVSGNVLLTKTEIGLGNVTNNQQLPMSYLDTDAAMTANSDLRVPTQKAIKGYVDVLSAVNAHGVINLPTITDNLNGTITIGTDGVIQFHKDSNGNNGLVRLSVVNGKTLPMTDNAINFVYCNYNAGVPEYLSTTDSTIYYTNSNYSPVARVVREGLSLTIEDYGNYGASQSEKILYKDTVLNGFERCSGLVLSTSIGKQLNISAGSFWFGIKREFIPEYNTTTNSLYEYFKVGGTWTKSANMTAFDSTSYQSLSDRMTLADGKYVAKYIYRATSNNEAYYISGDEHNSISSALAEREPQGPSVMLYHSIYVGKIIVQKNATLGYAYPRIWDKHEVEAGILSHDDLENIEQAGIGIENGHISNTAQIIYGKKDFVENIGASDIILTSTSGQNVVSQSVSDSLEAIDNTFTVSKACTGFSNSSSISVAYNKTLRTITLNGSFEAYYKGKKVSVLTNGWVSSAHPDVEGNYYLSYNGTSFQWSTSKWEYADTLHIAYVVYKTSYKLAIKETHGFIGYLEHEILHNNLGLYKKSGGAISDIALNSTIAANRRPSIFTTEVSDEALITTLDLLPQGSYSAMNLVNNGDVEIIGSNVDIVKALALNPYYNKLNGSTWTQELMLNDNYQAIFIIAMPTSSDADSKKFRYLFMQGQKQSSVLSEIESVSPASLKYGKFKEDFEEFVFIGKIIIKYSSGDWTVVKYESLDGSKISQLKEISYEMYSDNTISGNGMSEYPLSVNWNTVATLDNKVIDGGTF